MPAFTRAAQLLSDVCAVYMQTPAGCYSGIKPGRVCWEKASLCYRDEAVSVLLAGQAGCSYHPGTCLLDNKSDKICLGKAKELVVVIYTKDVGTPSAGAFDVSAALVVTDLL